MNLAPFFLEPSALGASVGTCFFSVVSQTEHVGLFPKQCHFYLRKFQCGLLYGQCMPQHGAPTWEESWNLKVSVWILVSFCFQTVLSTFLDIFVPAALWLACLQEVNCLLLKVGSLGSVT